MVNILLITKKIINFAAQKSASGYLCRATNTIKA